MNNKLVRKVKFHKQAISCAVLLLSMSVQAQQANTPTGGDVKKQGSEINYNAGASNIDGKKEVANADKSNKSLGGNIMDPGQAAQTMQVPVTPPTGLPTDQAQIQGQQGTQIRQQNSMNGQISQVDATLTILNTDKKKLRALNKDIYDAGKVIAEQPVTPPKSINDVIVAHLGPGSTAPVIRLSKNRTTAILLTDSSGQPWPIINYDGLSEEDFTVKRLDNPAPDGYVLSITPKGAFVNGNLTLILKGLPSPFNIEFVSAQKEVDGTTQIRVQSIGPNSQYTSMGMPNAIDTSLLNILQGVGPSNSKELKVSSKAVQAWLAKDGSMYVRTRYKIMAPAYENVTSSPDGTFAYKMVPVDNVLYKSTDGRFGEFSVEGY